jgi:hypothetical protein
LPDAVVAERFYPQEGLVWIIENTCCHFLILAAVYCSWRLCGLQVSHYNNFSHWLLVIRYLFVNDSLPGQAADLIYFKSFPTGSACLVYYFARLVPVQSFPLPLRRRFLSIAASCPCSSSAGKTKDSVTS